MKLGHAPSLGKARPKLGGGVRMRPHGRYLIFYREHETTLRIERVMHSARDIAGDGFELDD